MPVTRPSIPFKLASPHVPVKFDGSKCLALLDTGAEVCLCTSAFLIKIKSLAQLNPAPLRIISADYSSSAAKGKVTIDLQIGTRSDVVDFVVIHSDKSSVTIGWNYLAAAGFIIDAERRTLSLAGHQDVPFFEQGQTDEFATALNHDNLPFIAMRKAQAGPAIPDPRDTNWYCTFRATQTFNLPARTTGQVPVTSNYLGTAFKVATERGNSAGSRASLPPQVIVPRLNITTDDTKIWIRNFGHKPYTIRAGQVLAFGEQFTQIGALSMRHASEREMMHSISSMTVGCTNNGTINQPPVPGERPPEMPKDMDDPAWEKFKFGPINKNTLDKLKRLILEFHEMMVFEKKHSKPAYVQPITLDLKDDARPKRQQPYRKSLAENEIIRTIVQDLLEAGLIVESTSEWAAPIHLVMKKDGTLRPVCDYRRANEMIKDDAYPMHRVDDNLDSLRGSVWFVVLDLFSGFWQIPLDEQSQPITAFLYMRWVVSLDNLSVWN